MSEINNIKFNFLSDSGLVQRLGAFIKHHRLAQNKTQSQLATDAGINRSTLVQFEKGMSANIITFIQLLRALDLLHVFQYFEVEDELSPMMLAEMDMNKRKRASSKKSNIVRKKSNW